MPSLPEITSPTAVLFRQTRPFHIYNRSVVSKLHTPPRSIPPTNQPCHLKQRSIRTQILPNPQILSPLCLSSLILPSPSLFLPRIFNSTSPNLHLPNFHSPLKLPVRRVPCKRCPRWNMCEMREFKRWVKR